MSMNPPDCTLVTACFNLTKFHKGTFDTEKIITNTKTTVAMPCYMVWYVDEETYPIIEKGRRENGLSELTKIHVVKYEDLWCSQFTEKVKSNREIYWPTRDARTCAESHLLVLNKFDFVLNVINENPFKTSKFGWIDSFVGVNARKICEDYTHDLLLTVLKNITDKFHIQIMNVTDKKYKLPENKKEFYKVYRCIVCGSFFACGRDIGLKILTRLKQISVETTMMGYGHGEKAMYLDVLDEFYDDIHRGYGDYGQILNNIIRPLRNINYINHFILKNYIAHRYYREAYDCSAILLEQIDREEVKVDASIQMDILYANYVSAYYHRPVKAIEILSQIRNKLERSESLKNVYLQRKDFYETQFDYIKYLKQT